MTFLHPEFYLLFPLLLAVYWLIPSHRIRKYFLLVCNCYLYAWWDCRFLFLVLGQAGLDYFLARTIEHTDQHFRRTTLLLVSLGINLSLLAFFKYCNFFLQSLAELTGDHFSLLNIILPLGISFYTFRAVSYVVDVYQKRMRATNSLADHLLFMTFFPVMLAGPIVRANHLMPQLRHSRSFCLDHLSRGFALLVTGLFQKIFIADRLAFFVNQVFADYPVYASLTCWLAILAYTAQIFCDFQGYSNMAIGVSRMLGYDIPRNFDWPYLATSISEFWRRWHITLSTWIRDYIYIPLGGNRKGAVRTYANLLMAMSLCGLWHGAAWSFVVWGLFHGLALAVHRVWKNSSTGKLPFLPALIFTQLTVIAGWVLFRASDLQQAAGFLLRLVIVQDGVQWPQPFVIGTILLGILLHGYRLIHRQDIPLLPARAWYTPTVLFCMLWLVLVFPPKEFAPFVYARF